MKFMITSRTKAFDRDRKPYLRLQLAPVSDTAATSKLPEATLVITDQTPDSPFEKRDTGDIVEIG